MKNNSNLMYLMMVGGISIAVALGGAGLGIALKNDSTTAETNSPYLYGKMTDEDIDGTTKEVAKLLSTATNNKKVIAAFAANGENTLVDGDFWTKIIGIKGEVEKVTTGITANGLAKNVAGYQNKVVFTVSSATNNAFSNVKQFDLQVVQSWNDKGAVVYALTSLNQAAAKAGSGTASAALFGGKIANGADLGKYVFSKSGSTANANGSDAEFAWTVDASTGAVKMISRNVVATDVISIAVNTATRKTTFLG